MADKNEALTKSVEQLLKTFFAKAKPVEHDYPEKNVMDDLIGPAQVLKDDMPQNANSPTSPDYGMQPSDIRNEQGEKARTPNVKEQKAPTSPDYGLQPQDLKAEPDNSDDLKLESNDSQIAPTSPDLGEQPEMTYEEKEGDRGRPGEVHDVPDIDAELPGGKGYKHIQHETAKIPGADTTSADSEPNEFYEDLKSKMKKGEAFFINKADYELLREAKRRAREESMQKAKKEQADLMKSVVSSEIAALKGENEELRKSMKETLDLLKNISRVPQPRKSIATAQVLEKSFGGMSPQDSKTFTKAEMLDAAEALMKSNTIPVEAVIELERSGTVSRPDYRKAIESQLLKK